MIKALLFDLDGTLLPMDNAHFMKIYLADVSTRIPGQDPRAMGKAIMGASLAVAARDGEAGTNKEMFYRLFIQMTGLEQRACEAVYDHYYAREFTKLGAHFPPEPLARQIMDIARAKGFLRALATVPLFPRDAVLARMDWAGLCAQDFDLVSSYEDFSTCKPHPDFFCDVADRLKVLPQECLMVGNDARDDIAPARAAGMEVFFLTPYAIGEVGEDVASGDYAALLAFIQQLPAHG